MANLGAAHPNPRSARAYERVPSRRMPKRLEVDIDGRRLSLSNLDKVFYPETGFTKGQVIDYYTRVAPVLLPHLRGRPLTLKRYPDGVGGPYFYEKQCPRHRPDWVVTSAVWSRHNARTIDICLADDLATLVWLANHAHLERQTSPPPTATPRCGPPRMDRPRRSSPSTSPRARRRRSWSARRSPCNSARRSSTSGSRRSRRPPGPRGCRSTCRSTRRPATTRPSRSPAAWRRCSSAATPPSWSRT